MQVSINLSSLFLVFNKSKEICTCVLKNRSLKKVVFPVAWMPQNIIASIFLKIRPRIYTKKGRINLILPFFDAESEGFEPPDLLQSTVFKTAAFDHSASSPLQKYKLSLTLQTRKAFFLYKLDNYLTQREKKLFLLYIFFNRLRFFEQIKGRADNLHTPFTYINTGIQFETNQ